MAKKTSTNYTVPSSMSNTRAIKDVIDKKLTKVGYLKRSASVPIRSAGATKVKTR